MAAQRRLNKRSSLETALYEQQSRGKHDPFDMARAQAAYGGQEVMRVKILLSRGRAMASLEHLPRTLPYYIIIYKVAMADMSNGPLENVTEKTREHLLASKKGPRRKKAQRNMKSSLTPPASLPTAPSTAPPSRFAARMTSRHVNEASLYDMNQRSAAIEPPRRSNTSIEVPNANNTVPPMTVDLSLPPGTIIHINGVPINVDDLGIPPRPNPKYEQDAVARQQQQDAQPRARDSTASVSSALMPSRTTSINFSRPWQPQQHMQERPLREDADEVSSIDTVDTFTLDPEGYPRVAQTAVGGKGKLVESPKVSRSTPKK
ncbi:hypothetical protein BAUCODRAFT_144786 [Baudoinia panamericana UAMH 10762]|uniref:Uncharacterized protein n=1 Tax=Baudoinia panamericana (strain UAMH 10762) TaxID=717646 RepID=M2NNW7_BAUPA|nr:uncharacterized protein BAUCODRAFT_144786 [Baudoinia panamericana UAMH 10762]EMD01235.1 hypothetical protein BAUCODRAFT_144786 [Baudoinia panamericana UAMH 10762]